MIQLAASVVVFIWCGGRLAGCSFFLSKVQQGRDQMKRGRSMLVYWSSYSSQVSTCQLNCVTWHQREQRVTTTTSAISAFLFFFFLLSQFNWWYTTWGHFLPLSCPTEPMCYWRVLINRSNTILFFFFFFLQDLIIGLQQSLRHRRRNRNVITATTTRRSPAAAVIRTLLQFRRY